MKLDPEMTADACERLRKLNESFLQKLKAYRTDKSSECFYDLYNVANELVRRRNVLENIINDAMKAAYDSKENPIVINDIQEPRKIILESLALIKEYFSLFEGRITINS